MYTVIRQRDGSLVEAVVLDIRRSRIRLATVGLDDEIQLRRYGLDWLDDRDEPVEFGFLLAKDAGSSELPMPGPRTAGCIILEGAHLNPPVHPNNDMKTNERARCCFGRAIVAVVTPNKH